MKHRDTYFHQADTPMLTKEEGQIVIALCVVNGCDLEAVRSTNEAGACTTPARAAVVEYLTEKAWTPAHIADLLHMTYEGVWLIQRRLKRNG